MSATTPKLYSIGAVEAKLETTFNVAETSGFSPIRVVEKVDRSGLTYEAIPHEFVKDAIWHVPPIAGAKGGTITLKCNVLGSSNSDPGSAPTISTNPLSQFFAQALGNSTVGGWTDGEGSSTTSTLKGSDLSSFTAGQGVVWNTASNGTQMGWLKDNDASPSPDEADLLQTAVAVPSGGKIFGTSTAYMTSGFDWADGGKNSWTIRLDSHDTDSQIVCAGCRVSGLRINYEPKALVTCEIDFNVASWTEGSASGAQPYEWNYADPEPLVSARVAYGATAATTMRVGSMTFDLGMEVSESLNPNSEGGVDNFIVTARKPSVSFSVYRQVDQWPTYFTGGTQGIFSFVFGTGAGKMMGLALPAAYVTEYPHETDSDGYTGAEVVLEAGAYYGDTDGTPTGAQNTDCRISIT